MCQSLRQRITVHLHSRLREFKALQQVVNSTVELLGTHIGRDAEHLHRVISSSLDVETECSKIYGILLQEVILLLGKRKQLREEQLLRYGVPTLQRCCIVVVEHSFVRSLQIYKQKLRHKGRNGIATAHHCDTSRLFLRLTLEGQALLGCIARLVVLELALTQVRCLELKRCVLLELYRTALQRPTLRYSLLGALLEWVVVVSCRSTRLAIYGRGWLGDRYLDHLLIIEVDKRHHARLGERLPHCSIHNLPYSLIVGKFNLGLLCMHIHIDTLGIHREIEEERRKSPLGYQLLVSLRNRLIEIWRAEETTIYEHILLARVVACRLRPPHKALNRGYRGLDIDLQQVAPRGVAHNAHNSLHKCRRRKVVQRCAIAHKRARHLGVTERHTAELSLYIGRERRLLAVDKLASCRSVVEEVFDQKLRTHRRCHRCLRHKLSAIYQRSRAYLIILLTSQQLHLRHRSNRG